MRFRRRTGGSDKTDIRHLLGRAPPRGVVLLPFQVNRKRPTGASSSTTERSIVRKTSLCASGDSASTIQSAMSKENLTPQRRKVAITKLVSVIPDAKVRCGAGGHRRSPRRSGSTTLSQSFERCFNVVPGTPSAQGDVGSRDQTYHDGAIHPRISAYALSFRYPHSLNFRTISSRGRAFFTICPVRTPSAPPAALRRGV